MRKLLLAAAFALAAAAPALAGTLQEVTTHGMVLAIQGMDIDVAFTPDGKLSAYNGQITGTWRIDGDKLCLITNLQPEESCTVYPKDKKSGDTFEVTGEHGTATVKIK